MFRLAHSANISKKNTTVGTRQFAIPSHQRPSAHPSQARPSWHHLTPLSLFHTHTHRQWEDDYTGDPGIDGHHWTETDEFQGGESDWEDRGIIGVPSRDAKDTTSRSSRESREIAVLQGRVKRTSSWRDKVRYIKLYTKKLSSMLYPRLTPRQRASRACRRESPSRRPGRRAAG